jgi:hypothetical protein
MLALHTTSVDSMGGHGQRFRFWGSSIVLAMDASGEVPTGVRLIEELLKSFL